jgi:hypothetical protein
MGGWWCLLGDGRAWRERGERASAAGRTERCSFLFCLRGRVAPAQSRPPTPPHPPFFTHVPLKGPPPLKTAFCPPCPLPPPLHPPIFRLCRARSLLPLAATGGGLRPSQKKPSLREKRRKIPFVACLVVKNGRNPKTNKSASRRRGGVFSKERPPSCARVLAGPYQLFLKNKRISPLSDRSGGGPSSLSLRARPPPPAPPEKNRHASTTAADCYCPTTPAARRRRSSSAASTKPSAASSSRSSTCSNPAGPP